MGIYLGKIQNHYVHSRATYPILDFPAVKPRVPVRKFQLLMSMRFSTKSMKNRYINIWMTEGSPLPRSPFADSFWFISAVLSKGVVSPASNCLQFWKYNSVIIKLIVRHKLAKFTCFTLSNTTFSYETTFLFIVEGLIRFSRDVDSSWKMRIIRRFNRYSHLRRFDFTLTLDLGRLIWVYKSIPEWVSSSWCNISNLLIISLMINIFWNGSSTTQVITISRHTLLIILQMKIGD